ncbi:MAG TPA: LacI family DNA-binding transcriptional regulator [Microbacteriaceae bacterium]
MTPAPDAPRRRVTRADVARYAGVSPAVVSYTVNSGPGPVAASTRARVEDAIRVLGYRPNAAARTLKMGSTKLLGVVVPDSSNPFFARLGHALEDAATARGYALIVANVEGAPENYAPGIRNLASRQVDGILSAADVSVGSLTALAESGVPAVLLNQFEAVEGLQAIGPDLYGGARTAMEHLLWHGHKNIAFVGETGPRDLRERGWRDALAEAGRPPGRAVAGAYTREGGYAAGQALLASGNTPTAIFASSDQQGVGVLRALHEANVPVPQQIAIVSFDGSPESEYSWPALTTLEQPVQEMAIDAIEKLLHPIAVSSFTLYASTLIVRQSCGCAARY